MSSLPDRAHPWLGIVVAAAMVAGLCLRVWPLGRLGLNQFDEGIYAMAATWAIHPGGLSSIDPGLIPYAPPGYPILVGVLARQIGFSDQVSFLVSALAGTLTIPVVAWIAYRVFGPLAAGVSAWCVSCSGPHIAFSRMGLTDSGFLLVWSLGFGVGLEFVRRPGWRTGLLMGAMVGLAQQFKYNGWLLGGILLGHAAVGLVVDPALRTRAYTARLVGWGGVAIALAWEIVAPWYRFVDQHGGYSALLAHQRSYLGGPSAWWPHLRSQANQAVVLAGPGWLGVVTIAAIGVIVLGRPAIPRPVSAASFLVRLGLIGSLLAAPVTSGVILGLGQNRLGNASVRCVALSWVVLFVLAPFYHPYARLWLPFELLHWVILGGLAAAWFGVESGDRETWWPALESPAQRWGTGLVVAGTLVAGPGFPLVIGQGFHHNGLFDPSDSLRIAAEEIVAQVPPDVSRVRTLIRPSLSYYLAGRLPLAAQGDRTQFDRDSGTREWGLVDSTVLEIWNATPSDGGHHDRLPLDRDRWDVVAEFPVSSSLPTTLDLDPTARDTSPQRRMHTLWLLRPRTPDASR